MLGTASMLKIFDADFLVLLHTPVFASWGLGLAGVPKDYLTFYSPNSISPDRKSKWQVPLDFQSPKVWSLFVLG